MLYGSTPFDEVQSLAAELRTTAQRAGALRAVAFASALSGEAALLAGDLDVAERALHESMDLHRDIGASAGEAHCLQRLAEVHLAQGDRDEAMRLLQRALPLARWSALSLHLLQRIYGTMILSSSSVEEARAVVDRAESALGTEDRCQFCNIMLAVPASIACSQVGDVEGARRHLAAATSSMQFWDSASWTAATGEARAHLAAAEGRTDEAASLFDEAARLFTIAGQPLDAARCSEAVDGARSVPVRSAPAPH
jgi:tetratricopeptide (TPR) repeat protein